MNAASTDCDEEDIALARAVLQQGEQAVLVVKPKQQLAAGRHTLQVLMGALLLALLCGATLCCSSFRWAAVLIALPLWWKGLWLLGARRRARRRFSCMLYLLTNRRALVLEPKALGYRCVAWPLYEGLVSEVMIEEDGSGSILFDDYMLRDCCARSRSLPRGFMQVPQVERVRQLIAELVDNLPVETEPQLFSPRGSVTMRDADGIFLADESHPEKEYSLAGGMLFGSLFALFALFMASVGGSALLRDMRLDAEGEITSGRVVRMDVSKSQTGRSRDSHFAIIHFTDSTGGLREYRSSFNCDPKEYPVGAETELCYLATDPTQVRMQDERGKGLWILLTSALFFWIGVAMVKYGIRVYMNRRKLS